MVNAFAAPDALARVSAIGPYFAVASGPRPDAGGFRPLTELYADPDTVDACVRAVSGRLGTDESRVAASTLHLGAASRLWSVALAYTALTGRVADLRPDRLRWRLPASGPWTCGSPTPRRRTRTRSPACTARCWPTTCSPGPRPYGTCRECRRAPCTATPPLR